MVCINYTLVLLIIVRIPPLHVLKLFYLLRVLVKCNLQVGERIRGQECTKHTSVRLGVGVLHIADLKIGLERATSFVPPHLQPDFFRRDHTIVPSELIVATYVHTNKNSFPYSKLLSNLASCSRSSKTLSGR